MSLLTKERANFHHYLIKQGILTFSPFDKYGIDRICSNADSGQRYSVQIANFIADSLSEQLNLPLQVVKKKKKGQTLGNAFELACADFLRNTFLKFHSLRPGNWIIEQLSSRNQSVLGNYEQYAHLAELARLASDHTELRNFLGDGYTVSPDITIARLPESDSVINSKHSLVDNHSCLQAMLRTSNHNTDQPTPLLHASISCKFTMRSDRAQNTRTEALNLIRARKGRVPHIISVTAEPTISRIASLALGTGDLDCVYHFALYELHQSLERLQAEDSLEQLTAMVEGKRLKDISDLPLDLAI